MGDAGDILKNSQKIMPLDMHTGIPLPEFWAVQDSSEYLVTRADSGLSGTAAKVW